MKRILLFNLFLCHALTLLGQIDSTATNASLDYGSKGWEFRYGENHLMQLQFRLQFRTTFTDQPPEFFLNEADNVNGSFTIQRARLKVGGHVFKPYLKYYLEYDFPSNNLLNWEMTISKFKGLQFKLGQWKVNYNTERFVSSGKQQFVDRSEANKYFTLDRQIGAMVFGTVFDGKIGSSSYQLGVFNGNGRGMQNNDGHGMYFARYQWNLSRKIAESSFSDLNRVQVPEGFIAMSFVRNKSIYTSFSSNGGGQLPGFSNDNGTLYNVHQLGLELMFKFQGFSLMAENHHKNINDLLLQQTTRLNGGYIMGGYFFNEVFDFVPKKLELIARYSLINHTGFADQLNEYSFGFNWFFKNHLNKITADFSFFKNMDFENGKNNHRIRLQWDVSF